MTHPKLQLRLWLVSFSATMYLNYLLNFSLYKDTTTPRTSPKATEVELNPTSSCNSASAGVATGTSTTMQPLDMDNGGIPDYLLARVDATPNNHSTDTRLPDMSPNDTYRNMLHAPFDSDDDDDDDDDDKEAEMGLWG